MQSIHNDEDWSIISSSSDMDDDHSTSSSVIGNNRNLSPEQDKTVSSVGTLKLPIITPDCDAGVKYEAPKSPEKPKVEPIVEDSPQAEDRNIDNVIKFYENLSIRTGKWNDTIKQKSSDFYQNVAKLRLEQFGKLISSKDAVDVMSNNKGETMDMDSEGDIDITEDIVNATLEASLYDEHERKTSDNCIVLSFECLQEFLEDNSEYMFYYFVTSILGVTSLIGFYNINWNTVLYSQKQSPTTSIVTTSLSYIENASVRCKAYLEELFYEDSYPTSRYFGLYQITPAKTIKFSKKLELWKKHDLVKVNGWLHNLKQNGIRVFSIWWSHIKQNEIVEVDKLWHHFKHRYIENLFHFMLHGLHQIPGCISIANRSLVGSFNRYCKISSLEHIIHNAKSNVDKSANCVYRSCYPLRKFIADSMNV